MLDDSPDDAQRFSLHLPGLLQVLAEHLYSSRTVTVRELIQNAHDSCTVASWNIRERAIARGLILKPTWQRER